MTRLTKAISRITRDAFSHYGPDRGKPFVATLAPGDLLMLRPLRSRTTQAIAIRLADVYRYALMCRENAKRLEKARAKKAILIERRKQRRLARDVAKEHS